MNFFFVFILVEFIINFSILLIKARAEYNIKKLQIDNFKFYLIVLYPMRWDDDFLDDIVKVELEKTRYVSYVKKELSYYYPLSLIIK